MEKFRCQQKSRDVSRDLYTFLIFFGQGIIMPIFIFVEYVEQILGRGGEGTFNTPPIC